MDLKQMISEGTVGEVVEKACSYSTQHKLIAINWRFSFEMIYKNLKPMQMISKNWIYSGSRKQKRQE